MFGHSKPIAFDPYRRQRRGGRPPRWLVLLAVGVAIGAGGLYVAQERFLPPRLSASESAALRDAHQAAEAARVRLATELGSTSKQLEAPRTDKKPFAHEIAADRASIEGLRADLAAVVASLPPDPRGSAVEVRAARFHVNGAALDYALLLTRERGTAKPLAAVLTLAIAGVSSRGVPATFAPPTVAVSIGAHEVVRGSFALPNGFKPDQTTVQVLDRAGGKTLGMRVLLVK